MLFVWTLLYYSTIHKIFLSLYCKISSCNGLYFKVKTQCINLMCVLATVSNEIDVSSCWLTAPRFFSLQHWSPYVRRICKSLSLAMADELLLCYFPQLCMNQECKYVSPDEESICAVGWGHCAAVGGAYWLIGPHTGSGRWWRRSISPSALWDAAVKLVGQRPDQSCPTQLNLLIQFVTTSYPLPSHPDLHSTHAHPVRVSAWHSGCPAGKGTPCSTKAAVSCLSMTSVGWAAQIQCAFQEQP